MNCLNENEQLLFLKYAVPCATTLVKRKTISQEFFENLVNSVKKEVIPKNEPEKIFKVAYAMCTAMAQDKGKEIDTEIIREYYWQKHDEVVMQRFEEKKDFDPIHCKTYPGVVKKVKKGKASVQTVNGEKDYFTDFTAEIKKGDHVVVHRDFISEKISMETAVQIAKKTGKAFGKKLKKAKGIVLMDA